MLKIHKKNLEFYIDVSNNRTEIRELSNLYEINKKNFTFDAASGNYYFYNNTFNMSNSTIKRKINLQITFEQFKQLLQKESNYYFY